MAKKKNPLKLQLAVLAGLVVVALLAIDPFHWLHPTQDKVLSKDPGSRTLVPVKRDDISSVEIRAAGETSGFTLVHEKDRWFAVKGDKRYKANMDHVDPLLDDLGELRSEALVTRKTDKFDELELTKEKAMTVLVFAGKTTPEVTLLVGKAAEGYQNAFVRLGEGPEVYRTARNLRQEAAFSYDDFKTKTPWDFDPATATEVTIRKAPATDPKAAAVQNTDGKTLPKPDIISNQTWTFSKKDKFWQLPNGHNGNQNAITTLLKDLGNLNITAYEDNPTVELTGLGAATQPSIIVTTPAGKWAITIGPETAGTRYAVDQDGLTYRLSAYTLNFYLKDMDFDRLTFDDTAAEANKAADKDKKSGGAGESGEPAEGIEKSGLPSDADEGKK